MCLKVDVILILVISMHFHSSTVMKGPILYFHFQILMLYPKLPWNSLTRLIIHNTL